MVSAPSKFGALWYITDFNTLHQYVGWQCWFAYTCMYTTVRSRCWNTSSI